MENNLIHNINHNQKMSNPSVPIPTTLATHIPSDKPVLVIAIDEYNGDYITETFEAQAIVAPPKEFRLAEDANINNVPIR